MKNKIKEKIYNICRNKAKKDLTGQLGKVVEKDDKLICYVKKRNCKKDGCNYYLFCNGIRDIDKKLANFFNLNKSICYIFEDLEFNSKVSIYGYNCEIIIKNCNFEYGLDIKVDKCILDNIKVDKPYNKISLYAKDLTLKNTNINNTLSLANTKLDIIIEASKKLSIVNSNIGKEKEKTNVVISAGNHIDIFDSKVTGEEIECKTNTINSDNSSLIASSIIELETTDLNKLSVISPIVLYNQKDLSSQNESIVIEKVEDELSNKRLEFVEVLKQIKQECEKVNDEKINKINEKLINKSVGKILTK